MLVLGKIRLKVGLDRRKQFKKLNNQENPLILTLFALCGVGEREKRERKIEQPERMNKILSIENA